MTWIKKKLFNLAWISFFLPLSEAPLQMQKMKHLIFLLLFSAGHMKALMTIKFYIKQICSQPISQNQNAAIIV